MTRKKCEKKLLHLLEKAVEIYHEYNPAGVHLGLCYVDGNLNVMDAIRGEDGQYIDSTQDWNGAHTIYADKNSDGRIWYGKDWAKMFGISEPLKEGGATE